MTEHDNTQAVIDTATRAARPEPLDSEGRFYSVVVPEHGSLEVIDLEKKLEQFRETPRRKTGVYSVHDAESFLAYLAKHGDPDTEVWADVINSRVTAVLNAHRGESVVDEIDHQPRWEDHRVVYQVATTDAWKAWTQFDGKLLDQATFAEHIENRTVDIVVPSGAEMLELSQTFQATIGVSFESSKLLSSGERQLEYREKVDATAGKAGRMEIPSVFKLALRPFEGADVFGVTARLRYRITDGTLRIGYRLERPEDVLREAFMSVVAAIDEGTEKPALRGTPR